MPQATTLCKSIRAQQGTRTKTLAYATSYDTTLRKAICAQHSTRTKNPKYLCHKLRRCVKQLLRNTTPGQGAQESNSYYMNKNKIKNLLTPQALWYDVV